MNLPLVPPRIPKGHGWPGAEALAWNPGYQGFVLILKPRLPVGPARSLSPVYLCCQSLTRKLLFLLSQRVVEIHSLMPGKCFDFNDFEKKKKNPINKIVVVSSSLLGLGCDSRRALRVTALSCYGSWASPSSPSPSPELADGFGIHKNNTSSSWEQKRGEQTPSPMTEVTFRLP